jgi:hypothetical protein
VQSDILDPDEVLARGKRLRKGELDGAHPVGREGNAGPAVGDSRDLVNLEPDSTAPVPAGDIDTRRCLGQVDVCGLQTSSKYISLRGET